WTQPDRWPKRSLEELEERIAADPWNIALRGEAIARANGGCPPREDSTHLRWMIEHYPAWDGFWITPMNGFFRSESTRARFRQLWLEQVDDNPTEAKVLFSAA